MYFHAKTGPVQSIQEHTDDLLFVMEKIKNSLGSSSLIDWKLMKLIIIAHDLGKINSLFQERIRNAAENAENKDEKKWVKHERKAGEIDHNLLSGAFLRELLKESGIDESTKQILYKAVMFHHKNYLYYVEHSDRCSPDKIQKSINEHIEKAYHGDEKRIKDLNNYLQSKLGIQSGVDLLNLDYDFFHYNHEWFDNDDDSTKKRSYLVLKGMLHLCDYIASSGFKNYSEFYFTPREIESIDKSLLSFLKEKTGKADLVFKEFQERTKAHIDRDILTIAFTGSGKTAADHRWAGIRKFYLVPTRISGEAFYFDALKIYGEDNVGLLHGDVNLYIDNDDTDEDSISITKGSFQLTKHLSRPYIISTIDQIVTAIFKYPGYEKIFSALINAKITVDEIHLLSPRMYMLLLFLASFLKENNFNTRFHLMSATVPQVYKDKLEATGIVFEKNEVEIDPQNNSQIEFNEKSFAQNAETQVTQAIKNWIGSSNKAIIIVNTIQHAMDLYDALVPIYGIDRLNLLHSRFKFEDKKEKYSAILKNTAEGIWITTQVVEVALHIDFPVAISELSPFESLIQRMGRCNREGKLEKGFFYVFKDEKYKNENNGIYGVDYLEQTALFLKKHIKAGTVLSQIARKDLLHNYFDTDKVKDLYREEFEKAEQEILGLYDIHKSTKDKLEIKGSDLLFSIDPHMNLTGSKKQAQKLFREDEMQQKAILKSDFEKLLNSEPPKRFIEMNKLSIPISRGIYWVLKKKSPGSVIEQSNLLILDDSNKNIKYTSQKGLVIGALD